MTMTRWGGEAIRVVSTTVGALADVLPAFRRAPLSADLRETERSLRGRLASAIDPRQRTAAPHRYLDAIMLRSENGNEPEVPIAFVSKRYSLIFHRDLVA